MGPVAKRIIPVLTLMLLPLAAAAEPVAYGSDVLSLYRIDLGSGSGARVGGYGKSGGQDIVDMEGLALSGDGTLYGVADGFDILTRIDRETGRATVVGPLNIEGQGTGVGNNDFDYGLAFGCDGRLWMSSDATGKLFEVNPATGTASLVANLGHPITGLATRNGKLYGIGGQGDLGLYVIDPAAGTATRLGTVVVPNAPAAFQDAGLDFDAAGTLWATVDYNPQPGDPDRQIDRRDLLSLDVTDGRVLSSRTISNLPEFADIEGLAISPPICDSGEPGGGLQLAAIPSTGRGGMGLLAMLLFAIAAFVMLRPRGA